MSGTRASHYDVLGLSAEASGDDIRRAYRRAVRRHHPDLLVDASDEEIAVATQRMAEINEAHDVLTDPRRRAEYDLRVGVRRTRPPSSSAPPRRPKQRPPEPSMPEGFAEDAGAPPPTPGAAGRPHPGLNLVARSTDLRPLSALAPDGVRHLSCRHVPVDNDDLLPLSDLLGLQSLDLSGAPVSDKGMWAIARLPNLERLILAGTSVTDDGLWVLRRLPLLRELDLSDTRVDDGGLTGLLAHRNLEVLLLPGTDVTADGLATLTSSLPHLQRLVPPRLRRSTRHHLEQEHPELRLT